MTTALYTHSSSHGHVTPDGHPEQVARLAAIEQALALPPFAALHRVESPRCDDAALLRCHPQAHLDRIVHALPGEGLVPLDGDTFLAPGSMEAARHAVGGMLAACDAVMAGEVQNAFAAHRPPGHHAETATPMGFCLFGTVAIAAKYLLDHHGLDRVAVVDFDVHHGNGTQDLLWDEPRAMFISTHQMPLYPGTGSPVDRGAHGQVVNLPLADGDGSEAFRMTVEQGVLPALERHRPQAILISAGFDAHRADPLATLNLTTEDFAWVTDQLCTAAARTAEGRVVSTLEGGYDLPALAASTAAHVAVLMQRGERG